MQHLTLVRVVFRLIYTLKSDGWEVGREQDDGGWDEREHEAWLMMLAALSS